MIAIGAGVITLSVWLTLLNRDLAFSLERMVTVMVITCPHALGVAVPLVVAVSTSISARHGLLIRSRSAFEAARNINVMVFDKTGTLTEGEFGVTDVIVLDNRYDTDTLLRYAASVESRSEHPIARGIVASSKDTFNIEDFRSIPGKGAEATVNGKLVEIISPGYLVEQGISISNDRLKDLATQGKTVVYVIIDRHPVGAVALADIIRPESSPLVRRLKDLGIESVMITGDSDRVAAWVAGQLGIERYFAEVLPDGKTEKIKGLQAKGPGPRSTANWSMS
jgi:P-type Cu2+ transporter